jgi:hypothetical protein
MLSASAGPLFFASVGPLTILADFINALANGIASQQLPARNGAQTATWGQRR